MVAKLSLTLSYEDNDSGAMSGTATDFSNFSKLRLEGRRGDTID